MIDVYIDTLCIEVTRQCNMTCAHCLRGEATDMNIDLTDVSRVIKYTKYIGTICFTGGEPSLNVPGITRVLRLCQRNNVEVGNFYIATNGKYISNEFINAMIDWYMYCTDNEISAVALSQDMYHEPIPAESLKRLKTLSFFNPKDKATDFTRIPLINSGRAKEITNAPKRTLRDYNAQYYMENCVDVENDSIRFNDTITITCEGDILCACDYEYDNVNPYRLGRTFEFRDIIRRCIQIAS